MNKERNLVVACDGANKIEEYTTNGVLVREICLKADVSSPWHALQLSSGHYVVSRDTSPGVVSVVGVDGQVVRSYKGRMNHPRRLVVTRKDDILAADASNNRILSINSSLSSAQELTLSADGRIHRPRGLYLDESRGRLYVGEHSSVPSLLVFDVTL